MKQKIAKFIRKYLLRQKVSPNMKRFRVFIFFVTIVLLILIFRQREILLQHSGFGYLGVFIVNFVSNATVLLPLPGIASVFFAGAILSPILVGIVASIGSTLGELFSFFLGFGGRALIKSFEKKNHWLVDIEAMFHRAGFITILIFSILPLPFFDFIGLLAGAFNYPVWRFIGATFLGRLLRNLVIAFTGATMIP